MESQLRGLCGHQLTLRPWDDDPPTPAGKREWSSPPLPGPWKRDTCTRISKLALAGVSFVTMYRLPSHLPRRPGSQEASQAFQILPAPG